MQRDTDSKLNQIVQQYFSKAAQIIVQSRISTSPTYNPKAPGPPKLNKWFNIQLEDLEPYKEELKLWRTLDYQSSNIPRLVVETFLDLRKLSSENHLELVDSNGKSWVVNKGSKRKEIVLERWIIDFDVRNRSVEIEELPTIYKNVMILMRSLYTYSRLMPSWALKRKLSSVPSTCESIPLTVGCTVVNASNGISSKGRIGLSKSIKDGTSPELDEFEFSSITTHIGTFNLSVTYRAECDFGVVNDSGHCSSSSITATPTTALASSLTISTTSNQTAIESGGQVFTLDSFSTRPEAKSGIPSMVRRSSVTSSNAGSLPSPSKSSVEGSSYMASRHNVYKNHNKSSSNDFSSTGSESNTHFPTFGGSYNNVSPTEQSLHRRSSVTYKDKDAHSDFPVNSALSISTSNSPYIILSSQAASSPILTKPSVSFHPFKTPSLSASPSNDPFVLSTSATGSKPVSFSRTTSNSSLAALRIPNRSMSNASNTPSVGSYVKNQSAGAAGGLISHPNFNENAILSSSASSSRSGSVSRFSSSFGSRTGQWTRAGSITGTRPKHPSFSGNPSSIGSALTSSTSSSLEPGSGFLLNDDDGLDSFVKALDAIRNPKQANTSSSILLSGGGGSSGSTNSSLLLSNRLAPSTLALSGNTGLSTGSGNSLGDSESDKLSRFRHVRESHVALSDSIHSSQISKTEGSPTSGSNNLFSFPMSPPAIQKSGSAHTPSIPSRLSEGYTADDAYTPRYYSHPRKQESRLSLPIDEEEMFIHQDDQSRNHRRYDSLTLSNANLHDDSPDERRVSTSAMTNALDIPQTHASRVQRRESLSFSNRHTAGYRDMHASIDHNNQTAHHQSLNAVGHIFPDKELTSFRSSTTSNTYSRRLSGDQIPPTSGPSRPRSRRVSDIDDLNTQFNSVGLGNRISHMIANESGGPSVGPRRISLGGDDMMPSSSASARSTRFSYYRQDDDDDAMLGDRDEYDDEDKAIINPAGSLIPLDEDAFLVFDMNDDDGEIPKGTSAGSAGGLNIPQGSSGRPNDDALSGAGLYHNSSNKYDPLTWRE